MNIREGTNGDLVRCTDGADGLLLMSLNISHCKVSENL